MKMLQTVGEALKTKNYVKHNKDFILWIKMKIVFFLQLLPGFEWKALHMLLIFGPCFTIKMIIPGKWGEWMSWKNLHTPTSISTNFEKYFQSRHIKKNLSGVPLIKLLFSWHWNRHSIDTLA
jgi:hypothetical protein